MEVLEERPDIISFVESVAYEQEIKKYTITDVQTNEKGEGFLGQIFIMTIKDLESDKQLDVVVKAAFLNQKIRNKAPIRNSFLNEILFYTEVAEEFEKLETEHGLSSNNFVPKCYKVFSEVLEEKLCLENLKSLNFAVLDKKEVLDDDHAKFIFQVYGRFHAYMFALREQKPEEFGQIVHKLNNIFYDFTNTPNSIFNKVFVQLSSKIYNKYLVPGEDDEILEKFAKYLDEGIIGQFNNAIQVDSFSTILHGDCWSNNMLFKYEESENGKKLVDMRLIDLQLMKVGSPVCDLSYCLYSGASKATFDNLDALLKAYHDSFSETLKNLGGDPEKTFPFNILKEQWKKYSRFGMIMAFPIFQIKAVINKEDIIDLTDDFDQKTSQSAESPNMKIDEELYKTRVKELLYHMSEIDAL